jgi:superoxide dismutase, Fe-Mn family
VPYTLPDLDYDYAALEPHYSARALEIHHSKHHAAYVKGANSTLEKLAAAREHKEFETLVGLEKALAFHLSGHVLHSLFWKNLSPHGGGEPTGALGAAIDQHFGSFEAMKAQLTEATTTVQGSGWGALSWDAMGGRLYIEQIYDHQGNVGQSGITLLVFDAWEHAFYLQYQTDKAAYADALWHIVNWDDVAARYDRAIGFHLVDAR